ncbi:MAG TPA: hypothetical protein ENH55_12475 [Aurantimonas coralicida]|uniref:Uncharacterized protein n=1 Tax=Aurantimonas coralicida TaxID=182270 RepID=A0A9C9TGD9_9HYPH|nr:hypothetical protein [Aurantimonas coralicida]HEU00019.1 hypothetical protein [Aurantimonas coralicida]
MSWIGRNFQRRAIGLVVITTSSGTKGKVRTYTRIAFLIYAMINGVLFGAGAITALSFPALQEQWKYLISVVVALRLVFAAAIAWFIAPQVRARY